MMTWSRFRWRRWSPDPFGWDSSNGAYQVDAIVVPRERKQNLIGCVRVQLSARSVLAAVMLGLGLGLCIGVAIAAVAR